MHDFPQSPMDRRIDELGLEDRIRSDADAEAYVGALIDKFGLDKEWFSKLSVFRLRLAHEEYLAISDSSKRVSEASVRVAFNSLMDEWNTPAWTRISSVDELHVFRIVMSLVANPGSVSRLPDGSVASTCRPVEAVYLMSMLDSQRGIPPQLREKLRNPEWLASIPKKLQMANIPSIHTAPLISGDTKRAIEYMAARSKYFASRSDQEIIKQIDKVLSALAIP